MGETPADFRLIEYGAWEKVQTSQGLEFTLHPWVSPEQMQVDRTGSEVDLPLCERGRRARQRLMRAMLACGLARNRADLARQFGLSRARISQILGPARKR